MSSLTISLEFRQALAPLDGIVGGVREVAGEHDEVRLSIESVDRGHRFLERCLCVRIGRPFEAPMRIGQLNEVEIVLPRGERDARQAGREHHAAQPRELEKLPSIDCICHGHALQVR